jgi:NAD(P)-dependent dehydrogenase (short-subunit alcohol dehydrogenase family)
MSIVVITGASAGIGRATAVAFARRGWKVGLLARGAEGLDGARRDVERAGGQALVLAADVADYAQVDAAAERVEREWGPIDVWVNNAMATIFSDFLRVEPHDFARATEVTYLGAVWGTRAALSRMKPRDGGVIVQVGSALAYRSIPLQSPYCGAKSALRGFTDSLRSELLHDRSGVHLTMVHLSAFNTPQFDWARNRMPHRARPIGKIFQPEIAAESIYWAARHRRRELWVGLPAVQAIVANRFVPGLLDRYLAYTGYEGQQTDEPESPDRRDNLDQPVHGDHGARGRFDKAAVTRSFQVWATTHKAGLLAAAIPLLLLGSLMRKR